MNNKLLFFLGLIALFSCSKPRCPQPEAEVSSPTSHTITLQPGSEGTDAVINALQSNTNYGNNPFLTAEAWTQSGSDRIQRSLLDFDYSSIPSGATINSAVLTLYADTSYDYSAGIVPLGHYNGSVSSINNTPNSWYLSPVISPWNEQTVTWNTQPSINAATRLTEPASTSPSELYTIDITSFVQQEIAHPAAYFGFMLSLTTETPYAAIYFYSSDGQYANLHPKLVIQYTK